MLATILFLTLIIYYHIHLSRYCNHLSRSVHEWRRCVSVSVLYQLRQIPSDHNLSIDLALVKPPIIFERWLYNIGPTATMPVTIPEKIMARL